MFRLMNAFCIWGARLSSVHARCKQPNKKICSFPQRKKKICSFPRRKKRSALAEALSTGATSRAPRWIPDSISRAAAALLSKPGRHGTNSGHSCCSGGGAAPSGRRRPCRPGDGPVGERLAFPLSSPLRTRPRRRCARGLPFSRRHLGDVPVRRSVWWYCIALC